MYFKALLVVTGVLKPSTIMDEIGDAPDKVIAEIKKATKLIPRMMKVKAKDKKVTVACNLTFGVDTVQVFNGETSVKNASRLQQFFGKCIIGIAKLHQD